MAWISSSGRHQCQHFCVSCGHQRGKIVSICDLCASVQAPVSIVGRRPQSCPWLPLKALTQVATSTGMDRQRRPMLTGSASTVQSVKIASRLLFCPYVLEKHSNIQQFFCALLSKEVSNRLKRCDAHMSKTMEASYFGTVTKWRK